MSAGYSLMYKEVPIGHPWKAIPEDPNFAMDWHQIRVVSDDKKWLDSTLTARMLGFAESIAGPEGAFENLIVQDWGHIFNFIFIHKAHAMAFKLRFS